MLFAALPINSMDGILPNTLSNSVTGGGLFDIVDIKSGTTSISYPSQFDIAAILSTTAINNVSALLFAPYWFTKPSSSYNVYFQTSFEGNINFYVVIDTTSIWNFRIMTVIFYKKKA